MRLLCSRELMAPIKYPAVHNNEWLSCHLKAGQCHTRANTRFGSHLSASRSPPLPSISSALTHFQIAIAGSHFISNSTDSRLATELLRHIQDVPISAPSLRCEPSVCCQPCRGCAWYGCGGRCATTAASNAGGRPRGGGPAAGDPAMVCSCRRMLPVSGKTAEMPTPGTTPHQRRRARPGRECSTTPTVQQHRTCPAALSSNMRTCGRWRRCLPRLMKGRCSGSACVLWRRSGNMSVDRRLRLESRPGDGASVGGASEASCGRLPLDPHLRPA